MSVIYIVLPLAIVLAAIAVWAFLWAIRRGQYDDLETPALRMLHDDDAESGGKTSGGEEEEQKEKRERR